eukprot:GFYU01009592.1.p1 GENE.GFYU01009592.1~~GFYU01009592.1.p1  ORF type:complete len:483 (-),score=116.64 GFYU01009592.1:234-1682(-)
MSGRRSRVRDRESESGTEMKRQSRSTDAVKDYVAVYRPSLTDSKLIAASQSLIRDYKLTPPSRPQWRPTVNNAAAVQRLYLPHQLWSKDQGQLCYKAEANRDDERTPRLGVSVRFKSLQALDVAAATFTADVGLSLQLAVEEGLGVKASSFKLSKLSDYVPSEHKWVEECDSERFLLQAFCLKVYNLDRAQEYEISGPTTVEDLRVEDGVIRADFTVRGTFYNAVRVDNFPFDVSSWDVIIACVGGYSPGIVVEPSNLRSFDEFEVIGLHGSTEMGSDRWFPHGVEANVIPNSARAGESIIYARFHSRRRPMQTMLSLVVPTGLMALLGEVALAMAAGWIENENAATDPIAFQSTVLLTVFAVKFAFADSIPKGVPPTLLDRYIFMCVFLIFVSILLVAHVGQDALSDTQMPILYLAAFVIVHIYYGVVAWLGYRLPSADETEMLLAEPHASDEPTDTSYMHPGPWKMWSSMWFEHAEMRSR